MASVRRSPNKGASQEALSSCPFCGIGRTRYQFAESTNFVALYNIAPILPGHSLVIPKRHAASLFDLSPAEERDFMPFANLVTRILLEAFGARGFNWTIQERAEAGQTVEHLHLHVIPRRPFDLPHPGDWYMRLREAELEKEAASETMIDSGARRRLPPSDVDRVIRHVRAVARRAMTKDSVQPDAIE